MPGPLYLRQMRKNPLGLSARAPRRSIWSRALPGLRGPRASRHPGARRVLRDDVRLPHLRSRRGDLRRCGWWGRCSGKTAGKQAGPRCRLHSRANLCCTTPHGCPRQRREPRRSPWDCARGAERRERNLLFGGTAWDIERRGDAAARATLCAHRVAQCWS
ncbi:hypothetical protein B0H13DRAFT_1999527, partial [Mycena leptocephala]